MEDKDRYWSQLFDKQKVECKKENRYLEFKSNYQTVEKLGSYISALSNGACLDGQDYGYLYFGVQDKTLKIKGTTFDSGMIVKKNQILEVYLRRFVSPKIPFEIIPFNYYGKERIVVFRIPSAASEPTCYDQVPYIRVESATVDLRPYSDWMRIIYNSHKDWSIEVIPTATISDLDPEAITVARKGFIQRYPDMAEEITKWDDATFLDRAKLTINGGITRACMLLLGKDTSAYLLNHNCQIDWRLRTESETASELFTIPYILSTSKVIERVRNYRFKIYPNNSLIPAEVWKYDTKTLLEAMHNCIAHQDYVKDERIFVTEEKDQLIFENAGSFFEGSYEDYIEGKKTPRRYRNHFLAQAMVNLKMIDTQGYGIHTMFERQKERFLPMPDYDKSLSDRVKLTIPGNVINENYSLLLMERADLDLSTAILLDKVQKKQPITDAAVKILRKKNLIEGRKPNFYIARQLAQVTSQQVEYSKLKGYSDDVYCSMILDVLKNSPMTRSELNNVLLSQLPESLDEAKKLRKIGNLLRKLRVSGKVKLLPKKKWSVI